MQLLFFYGQYDYRASLTNFDKSLHPTPNPRILLRLLRFCTVLMYLTYSNTRLVLDLRYANLLQLISTSSLPVRYTVNRCLLACSFSFSESLLLFCTGSIYNTYLLTPSHPHPLSLSWQISSLLMGFFSRLVQQTAPSHSVILIKPQSTGTSLQTGQPFWKPAYYTDH